MDEGASARDEKGDRADPRSPRAVCWCAEGAIRKILGVGGEDNITPYLRVLAEPIRPQAVFELNDTGTHAEVLETFDEAIARLEREGEQPPHPML